MANKIEIKHEKKVTIATSTDNWDKVTKLLNHPLVNLERKNCEYHLSSLNNLTLADGRITEVGDLVPDLTYTPLEHLLIKERNEYLLLALSKLTADDLHIFLEHTLNGTSFLQLTKETQFKSHKTVQSHYKKTLKNLKKELKKYF